MYKPFVKFMTQCGDGVSVTMLETTDVNLWGTITGQGALVASCRKAAHVDRSGVPVVLARQPHRPALLVTPAIVEGVPVDIQFVLAGDLWNIYDFNFIYNLILKHGVKFSNLVIDDADKLKTNNQPLENN